MATTSGVTINETASSGTIGGLPLWSRRLLTMPPQLEAAGDQITGGGIPSVDSDQVLESAVAAPPDDFDTTSMDTQPWPSHDLAKSVASAFRRSTFSEDTAVGTWVQSS